MNTENYLSIATVSNMVEAEMIRQLLETGGVEATILSEQDSNFVFTVGDLGDIEVMIDTKDLDKANEIMENI